MEGDGADQARCGELTLQRISTNELTSSGIVRYLFSLEGLRGHVLHDHDRLVGILPFNFRDFHRISCIFWRAIDTGTQPLLETLRFGDPNARRLDTELRPPSGGESKIVSGHAPQRSAQSTGQSS